MLGYTPVSGTELRKRFETPLSEFPETVVVSVNDGIGRFDVTIPTAEVFVPGDWLARRFSGVTFTAVEKWLDAKNIFAKTITIKQDAIRKLDWT